MSELVRSDHSLRSVCFDVVELDLAGLMRRIAVIPFVLRFTDEEVGVRIRRGDGLHLVHAELEESVVSADSRPEGYRFADFIHRRDNELRLPGVHPLSRFGILGEPLIADLHETAEADFFLFLHRHEQVAPVFPQEVVSIGTFVESRTDVATGFDADNTNSVPPLMATHVEREALVAIVMKMAEAAGRNQMRDCHPFLDLAEAVTTAEEVATVACTVHPEDVRIRIIGTITKMLATTGTIFIVRKTISFCRIETSLLPMPHPCSFGVSLHVLLGLGTEPRFQHRIDQGFGRPERLDEWILVALNVFFEVNDADLSELAGFEIQELLGCDTTATMVAILVLVLPAVRLLGAFESGHGADAVSDDQDPFAGFGEAIVLGRESREVRLPGQISRLGFEPCRDDVGHGRQPSAFAGELHGLFPCRRKTILVVERHRVSEGLFLCLCHRTISFSSFRGLR